MFLSILHLYFLSICLLPFSVHIWTFCRIHFVGKIYHEEINSKLGSFHKLV